jgi:hypothetical protein
MWMLVRAEILILILADLFDLMYGMGMGSGRVVVRRSAGV